MPALEESLRKRLYQRAWDGLGRDGVRESTLAAPHCTPAVCGVSASEQRLALQPLPGTGFLGRGRLTGRHTCYTNRQGEAATETEGDEGKNKLEEVLGGRNRH